MSVAIALVAQWLLLLPAGLVLAVVLVRRRWRFDLIEGTLAGAATILLVKLAGALHGEARPFVVQGVRPLVAHAADNAFPSDHLAACGLAFVYLWPRSKPLALVTLIAAALIATARVLAHLHWPLDVAAGFALGAIAAGSVRAGLTLGRTRRAR